MDNKHLKGEYWFFPDGQIQFCDATVGDSNHEGVALDRICMELIDRFIGVVDMELKEVEYPYEFLFEIFNKFYGKNRVVEIRDRKGVADFIVECEKCLILNDTEKDLIYTVFDSHADYREIVMKYFGWIWFKQGVVGCYKLDSQTARNIIRGLENAMEEESIDCADSEFSVNIRVFDGDKVSEFFASLEDLKERRASSKDVAAMHSLFDVSSLDREIAHSHYKGKDGD